MRISGSATYEELCGIADDAAAYQSNVESMSSTFLSSIGDAQSIIGDISVAGWQDDVEARFEIFLTELYNGINAISDDFSGGGFATLKSTLGQLVTSIDSAKAEALNIKNTKETLAVTPSTITEEVQVPNPDQSPSHQRDLSQPYSPYITSIVTKDNPEFQRLTQLLSDQKRTLMGHAEISNGLISKLEGITFGVSVAPVGGGAGGAVTTGDEADADVAAAEAAAAEAAAAEAAVNSGKADYFIQRGDTCNIHGQTAQFYGQNGKYNYYNVDGMIYYDNGGSLVEVCAESVFNINYLQDQYGGWYGAVNTSNSGAASMGLPSAENVTSCDADYNRYGMTEYVNYSSMNHADPVVFETTNQYRSALYSPNPPALFEVSDLENANWRVGWSHGTAPKPTNDGKVTFAYDDRSGLYYQLDNNGNYLRDMYGMTPEEMAECYVIPNS